MADSPHDDQLLDELLAIEQLIQSTPDHLPGAPYDLDPALLRLAVREAEVLRRMRGEPSL